MKHIEKFAPPTRLDCEPMASVWEHRTDFPQGILYIQISDNPEAPEWVPLGDLLSETLRDKAFEGKFIVEQIKKYKEIKKK